MIAIIDNYDSFTYNLYQYFCECSLEPVRVFRNDELTVSDLRGLSPSAIVISPGPGRPEEAGISVEVIKTLSDSIPVLGVCLGHQAIGYSFGADIISAKTIKHGKTDPISNDGKGLFRGLGQDFSATRYHSLVIDPKTLPDCLEITATSPDGEIMGVRHKTLKIEGVQFHPESIATEFGKRIIKNFLNYKRKRFEFSTYLNKLSSRNNLTEEEAGDCMDELTEGNLSEAQMGALLLGLNTKGITETEIAGFAKNLMGKKSAFPAFPSAIDTCGTGGDGLGTFNVSSLAALVVAACGGQVAKHGNRAVSSLAGSADFYKELGIPIDLPATKSEGMLKQTGFTFLFAPQYHPAMRFAAKVRRELGVKTIMNMVGPLSNPAEAGHRMIGVFSKTLMEPMARAAKLLGAKRVMTLCADDGQDEISISANTQAFFIDENGIETKMVIKPSDFDMPSYSLGDIKGGNAADNVKIARDVQAGRGNEAIRDAVLVNAGAALFVQGTCPTIRAGFDMAQKHFRDGSINKKIDQILAFGASA